jgi:hypothetical protein
LHCEKRKAGFVARLFACAKMFPGNDRLARPFPPYLVSGDLSLEAENMAAPRCV